ncbi:putative methyltransferase C1347,09 OS=Schizosaccharomyces pombe (strain 972 / ATCC 24843) GN=SPBC1347.09 PE=3 SV=1 [Rhizoctonia solani AG-1 IB]|uniref:Putative methyltransferase C1347,09 n=1 Tax=Thanatephorus cucumeris (strain AG1-IB / isolate 7/3/14) TaxID=1108050 RepID=A0A0B7FEE8_THACB|nr:putative methyltransferase C1347,09 OS=Schizosaccharomyces pombe (strain 972 / ATCC 24843) GN=SPBC1347.09 PE=3 SV=1 [Rhizoctonia solani AG-1 IB]
MSETHSHEHIHAHHSSTVHHHNITPSGIKEANRQYFDSQAHHHSDGYEASPARQLATKKAIAAILEAVPFDEDKSVVMDYACGTGLLSQGLAPYTKTLIGVDISPKSVDYYNERVANQGIPPEEMRAICTELVERGTSDADPFDGIEFDVIVCTQAYHHFEDINGVTRSLVSYLKPQTGVLVVIDMIRSPESEKLHKDHGHVVVYKGGFEEESIRSAFVDAAALQNYSFKPAFQMGWQEKQVDLFIATGVRAAG